MQVYSTRILAVKGLTGSQTVTPPAGTLWVIRDIWVYWNLSSAPVTRFHAIGDVGQTFDYAEFTPVDTDQLHFWQGRQVLENSLTVTGSGDPLDVSVSGYTLTLP